MCVWIKNKYKIYFSYLNVHQEEPQHAVDTGEDPNPSNDPLGSGHRAHCLSFHWMADSYVPGKEEETQDSNTRSKLPTMCW